MFEKLRGIYPCRNEN